MNLWEKILEQGLAPRQLARAVALGFTIGLLPIPWGTSIICILVAWQFNLNQIALQAANYLVYPLQIALYLPFSWSIQHLLPGWFGNIPEPSWSLLNLDWQEAGNSLLQVQLAAIVGWLLSAPFFWGGVYFIVLTLLHRVDKIQKHRTNSFYN